MRPTSLVACAAALVAVAGAPAALADGDPPPGEPHRGHDDTSTSTPGHAQAAEIARRLQALAERASTGQRWKPAPKDAPVGAGGRWTATFDDSPRGHAHRALLKGDYDGALRWLERALAQKPRDARVLLEIATVLAASGDIEGAAAKYREYLLRVPEDDDARLWLAQTLSWSKDRKHREEAERLLDEFLAAFPWRHDALLARARTRSWNGEVRGAEADFDAYLARHPERRAEIEVELAIALSASKDQADLERALALYDARLAETPDPDLVLRRARVASWAGHTARADADYRAYLEEHPDEHGIVLEHGRALSWSRDKDARVRAVTVLDAYLAVHPDDPDGVLARARARSWSGDGRGAVADYRAYLRARPADEAARLELGRTLAESRDPAEAREGIAILRAALGRAPADDALRLALARALIDGPDDAARPEGIATLRVYLTRHPDDEDARLLLARALTGAKTKAALDEALTIYDSHLARHPADDAVRLQRARVRTWSRRTADAEADYRAYLARHPGEDGVVLELARALAEGPEPERSLPLFATYAGRHPGDFRARLSGARAMRWSRAFDDAEAELKAIARLPRSIADQDDYDMERLRLWAETGRRFDAYDLSIGILKRSPGNVEARAEYERLRLAVRAPSVTLTQFFYFDKSEISISSTTLSTRYPLRPSYGVLADASAWSLGSASERLFAARLNLGGFYRWRRVEVGATAGPRVFQLYAPQAGINAYAQASPTRWSNLTATWHYDDLYFDLLQPASVSGGVRGHAFALLGDAAYERWGLRALGRVGARIVRPENKDFEASATVTVRVKGPVSVGYSVQYMSWDSYDPAYWSPQAFAAHLGVVRVTQALSRPDFAYEAQGLIGVAGERVLAQPEAGFGFAFGLSGAAVYRPTPRVEVRLTAQYSQTIRQVPEAPAGGSTATSQPTVSTSRYWWILPSASVTVRF